MNRLYLAVFIASLFVLPTAIRAQDFGCPELPREDALPSLCAPPTSEVESANATPIVIALTVPEGTPLRIAIDQKTRLTRVGTVVHGKVVEPVYAFDETVIPAGSAVSGQVTGIEPVPLAKRLLAYSGGNFTPFHKYQISFDELKLPNGQAIEIKTVTSPGTAQVVHLVAAKGKESEANKKTVAARAVADAKDQAKSEIHSGIEQIKSPNLVQRAKAMLYAQSPVHRQFLEKGTRFNAALQTPLEFGEVMRNAAELASVGSAPAADTVLHARLSAGVSSADATRGSAVNAVLTEPIFSAEHRLLLPANTKLVGEVQDAKSARNFHRNGELRIAFNRIELPSGVQEAMQGTLEGMQVDRSAHLAMDQEGGTRATSPKTRYLSTGFSLLMLAAVSHPDAEHGTTDAAGDADTRAGAGISGSRVAGSLISLAARSQPVSLAFGALGATQSVYSNFLARGKDVTLPQNTPLEIGFAPPHEEAKKALPKAKD